MSISGGQGLDSTFTRTANANTTFEAGGERKMSEDRLSSTESR